jgi:serine/threonine protein phosphatase 1
VHKLDHEKGIWVIGDVHGEYDKLKALVAKLPSDANICFVGDLVDRGPDSFKVMDLVIKNAWLCVLGNHELMMLESVTKPETHLLWFNCGGGETIESYQDDKIFKMHLEWIKNLSYFYYFEIEGYKPLVVSHSYIHDVWVDKEHEYCEYDGDDILWRHMHNQTLFNKEIEDVNIFFNIFGHSILKEPKITDTYAMIDTGATYDKDGYGRLCAIHYPSLKTLYDI